MNARPEKPPPARPLPRRQNIPRPTLQHKNNFTMKRNKTALKPKSTQLTVLPSVDKGPQKSPKVVLPPISKDRKNTQSGLSLYQHPSLPPICTSPQKTSHRESSQQQAGTQSGKTCPEETSGSEDQRVNKTPSVETPAMSPEAVLRESKPYLTEYELEEIQDYQQVWYLGKEASKTRYSNVTETQDMECFNSGYDTEEGFYKAIISDHLAYRFEILAVIGTGYSGQVLKCIDHKTMELVAIKVIRSKDSVHQVGKAEVRNLEALRELDKTNTANIVHMKENFYFRNHLCITFELFEKDLYKALRDSSRRGLSEKEVRKYATDVLKCLQLLKKRRMIHGDLKPDNILLYKRGSEKRTAVCDFGGSYFVKHRHQPLIHTLYYVSPEMLLGKRCSPAIDMWSLGCVLAELHLGRCLFRGCNYKDQFSCIMKVLGIPPPEVLVQAPKKSDFFGAPGPSSNKKPALLKREKMPPVQLPAVKKTKAKKGVNVSEQCVSIWTADLYQLGLAPPPYDLKDEQFIDFPNKTDPAVRGCAPSVRHTALLQTDGQTDRQTAASRRRKRRKDVWYHAAVGVLEFVLVVGDRRECAERGSDPAGRPGASPGQPERHVPRGGGADGGYQAHTGGGSGSDNYREC
ncbi:dual specificity tyrosine-phosphorylation-regulated kinase 4-like isoform X1 [Seriola aureovittata]|uniref:dual specificity tyrosine-phosphorylation-regulated kinase 4-like isoform X1 n=1 Tax=Seriola aureovittata TaxID=2871759 RepID=UPI0024BE1758|nr:dual specificity tyrosine-phosphorylation-regulated kinase 4-like isoform X1 [Seriola aureovittata]XP_056244144.1 dual specificity tyrosine-phosphorylation-regulated kinase 4-like isoform X1 [Seriola aureovittata]